MIHVAVLGYGTVGSGVVEVISTNREELKNRIGDEVQVKYVLDLREFPGSSIEKILVHDFETIVNDDEVDIVVEAMGGLNPAYSFAKASLEHGKSYCTSNKELVAKYGPELLKLAEEKNSNFFFEASVGGGIPVIRPLNECLTADKILEICGILNGTTNYILTKMGDEGLPYDEVLKDAQAKGFAEADPTADVEGIDVANKLSILMALAFDQYVPPQDIPTVGITGVTMDDIAAARDRGCKIKLIAKAAVAGDGGLSCEIRPMEIPLDHPLAGVNNEFNAIYITGNAVDEVMFYGKGAGALPTGSAIVGDIISIMRTEALK